MAGPIKKVGPFTETVRPLRTPSETFQGLGREYYKDPGSTQHHDRVLRREGMGQKMTPKGDVRNIRKGR